MRRKIRLSESELVKLIKNVIKENRYSEEDLKYTHPRTGESCKIKIAENKVSKQEWDRFGSVLLCERWGDDMIVAELPVNGPSFDHVRDFICDRLERTYEILDQMMDYDDETELNESIYHRRWNVVDTPISCEVNYDDEENSEEF